MVFYKSVHYGERQTHFDRTPMISKVFQYTRATSTSASDPLIVDLPGKGSGALVIPETQQVVIPINSNPPDIYGTAMVYNYETGEKQQAFRTDINIMQLYRHNDILFVQLFNAWDLLAFNLKTGEKVTLPPTWKRVDKMCFSDKFIAHRNFEDQKSPIDLEKPFSIIISNPKTLEPINKIATSCFGIYDMQIQDEQLFVLGQDENPTYYRGNRQWSFLMSYERPTEKNPQKLKASFEYDANYGTDHSLKIENGTIYNSRWYPSLNTLWDMKTLNTQLEKREDKPENTAVLTKILEDTAVISDPKEIVIYRKKENKFEPVNTIEIDTNNPVTNIELFHFVNQKVLAVGFDNGDVQIRSLESFKIIRELRPPEDMTTVMHTKFHNGKLLVHYMKSSKQGTLGILWDVDQQKEELLIARDKLRGRDYKGWDDNMHIVGRDILVRSEDQLLVYKNVFSN